MIKMEEPVKFFKNIVHEPQDVVSLSSIPMYLYVGYLMGKFGSARVWMGTMLFITVAMATLYASFRAFLWRPFADSSECFAFLVPIESV
jgi:hypothetical protein